jgi:hypothetical protein
MNIKYYEGYTSVSKKEISIDEKEKVQNYTKTYFNDSGKIDKEEFYDHGKLYRVLYYSDIENYDKIKSFNLSNYLNTPFSIVNSVTKIKEYEWKCIYSFNSSGELTGVDKVLSINEGQEILNIAMDRNQQVREITKYYWEGNDLNYIFEYDKNGIIVSGFDVEYGEHATYLEIKNELKDSNFYENGYNFPKLLIGTSIPSCDTNVW